MTSLREELRSDAVESYDGSFSLALEKAREKLKAFQLADPRHYILQLIQAVVASGAERLEITEEYGLRCRIVLTFDGPGYARTEIEQLYEHLFLSQSVRSNDRLRELALGIASCQALQPYLIRLECGTTTWERTVELLGTRERIVERAPDDRLNRILIDRSAELGSEREVHLLRPACGAVPIPLLLNGEQINTPGARRLAAGCPWPAEGFHRGGTEGALGLPYESREATSLTLLRHGVVFARRSERRVHPALSVVAESTRLRKNASQSDVVEDAGYLEFLDEVQGAVLDFALQLARRAVPLYHRNEAQRFLLDCFTEWLTPQLVIDERVPRPPEIQSALEVPLLRDVKGRLRTLSEAAAHYRKDGVLSLSERRMPYAPTGQWLVLAPDTTELILLERVFPRRRWVDQELHRLAATDGRLGSVPPAQQPRALATHRVRRHSLMVPGELPCGYTRVMILRPGDRDTVRLPIEHLCAVVTVDDDRAQGATPEKVRSAHMALMEGVDALYGQLLERLQDDLLSHPDTSLRDAALEHVVTYWSWKMGPASGVEAARRAIGGAAWSARVFLTLMEHPVSLADVEAWLSRFDALAVASGGKVHDHALDASPAIARFLARVFGDGRIQQATMRAALHQVRTRQEALAGAADHPERLVPVEPSSDGDDEEVSAEVRAAAVRALRGEGAPAPSLRPPDPIAAASDPLTAGEIASPQPIAAIDSDPATVRDQLPPADIVSPQPIAASPQPAAAWLPGVARWAQVAFSQGDVAGLFLLPEDPSHAWLEVRRNGTASVEEGLFGIRVAGWVTSPGGPWTPEHEGILRGHLRALHDRLAERLPSLEPRAFPEARARLLRYLAHDPPALRARLQAAASDDAAIRAAVVPTSGGTTASLLTVWNAGADGLPVVLPLSRDPDLETVTPILDADAPMAFFRDVLGLAVEEASRPVDVAADERLLRVVRRELRLLRDRGGHRLTEALIRAVAWNPNLRELVGHDPVTGATGINPSHRTIRRLLRRFDEDRTLVPMLVSAVYTAVNRALEDVRDEDEIGFLQALLDSRGR